MYCKVFFLISKKIILKNLKKTEGSTESTVKGTKKEKKMRKQEHKRNQQKLITKKRTKEHRNRITRGESPSPRPIKKDRKSTRLNSSHESTSRMPSSA